MHHFDFAKRIQHRLIAATALVAVISLYGFGHTVVGEEPKTSENHEFLKNRLSEYPDADTDKDGLLTSEEWLAHAKKLRAENPRLQRGKRQIELPRGAKHESLMVPMRDGTKIATEVLLPAGKGPWPVLLFRTPYGRYASMQNVGIDVLNRNVAFVCQDFRGLYDSQGSFDRFAHEIEDGYDSVEWVADQEWCNGKVAMTGGSGPGIGAKLAMIGNSPHLVAIGTSVAASNPKKYIFYNGGVFREKMNDGWFNGQNLPVVEWPKPRTEVFTDQDRAKTLQANADGIETAMLDAGGWYDIFAQATLDDFAALQDKGKSRVVIGGSGHGKLDGLEYPRDAHGKANSMSWILHWLTGSNPEVMDTPPVRYFLMGDTMNPSAPGNTWKQAQSWPIPHVETSYYFTKDGGLETQRPSSESSLSYEYDPNDPVPSIGGANLFPPKGPMDQRPLRERDDILRFETEPLKTPLEITGKVLAELWINSDVPDTTFMAKLVDIYPNGYEALVTDSAVMARYWDGLDKPAPIEKGRTYKLTVDLLSTALVFDKGHKIGLHVTSSNAPRYEAHPNSFEPVNSYDNAPVAHNTLFLGGGHASKLILPVIEPGTSKDYAWP